MLASDMIREWVDIDLAVAETASRIATHLSPGSLVCWEYAVSVGHPDPDSLDSANEPGFADFLFTRAAQLVESKLARLAGSIDENDGAVCLYRGLFVDREWIDGDITGRPIGVCWSWDYDFAIAHRGETGSDTPIDVRLVGLVEMESIDWTETVILSATDEYVTGEEREVRLLPQAVVEVAAVDWRPSSYDSGREGYVSAPHLEGAGIFVKAAASDLTHGHPVPA